MEDDEDDEPLHPNDREAIELMAIGLRATLSDEQLGYLIECLPLRNQYEAVKIVAILKSAGIVPVPEAAK